MGQSIEFTKWWADWWLKQINLHKNMSAELKDGLQVYGKEHRLQKEDIFFGQL